VRRHRLKAASATSSAGAVLWLHDVPNGERLIGAEGCRLGHESGRQVSTLSQGPSGVLTLDRAPGGTGLTERLLGGMPLSTYPGAT
jgi:hypothetical protein